MAHGFVVVIDLGLESSLVFELFFHILVHIFESRAFFASWISEHVFPVGVPVAHCCADSSDKDVSAFQIHHIKLALDDVLHEANWKI